MLEHRFRKAAEILAAAEGDVTAYAAFPRAHWRKISGTNPSNGLSPSAATSAKNPWP